MPSDPSKDSSTSSEEREDDEPKLFRNIIKNPPATPLSAQKYFRGGPEVSQCTSPSPKTSSLPYLNILPLWEPQPGDVASNLIAAFEEKPILEECVKNLSQLMKLSGGSPETVLLVEKLFYKILDSILFQESKKTDCEVRALLNQDRFIKALYACAVEVINYTGAFNPFPWVLNVLHIAPFQFYKVIEVVVRHETTLDRELVKHLNRIEESVLESLAWKSESPLWESLLENGKLAPSCEDVAVQLETKKTIPTKFISISGDKLSYLAGKESVLINSPGAPLTDRFQSPQKPCFKRMSDPSNHEDEPLLKKVYLNSIHLWTDPGKATQGKTTDLPNETASDENKKTKRTSSNSLFFRKFYYLASVRMLNLVDQLTFNFQLTSPLSEVKQMMLELRQKIWTCFEQTIIHHVGIMRDRHLDQILMCSIYFVVRVLSESPTFVDILERYRFQPNAHADVYRNVLIYPDLSIEDLANGTGKQEESEEKYQDIISFFNQIFLKKPKIRELAKKMMKSSENERLILSPIPAGKAHCAFFGVKKVSENISIFLKKRDQEHVQMSPNAHEYHFCKSPAKDLQAINNMVCRADLKRVGKRIWKDDGSCADTPSNIVSKKAKDLYKDRVVRLGLTDKALFICRLEFFIKYLCNHVWHEVYFR